MSDNEKIAMEIWGVLVDEKFPGFINYYEIRGVNQYIEHKEIFIDVVTQVLNQRI